MYKNYPILPQFMPAFPLHLSGLAVLKRNSPVNCGATVPRVNLENLREAKKSGLCSSNIDSTLFLISSDAA